MKTLAIQELIEQFRAYTPEQLTSELSPEELRQVEESLTELEHDQIEKRCAEDPLYWAQNHTETENPHWEKQGLPYRAPFPKKSYFVPLFEALKKSTRLLIPKTREMLTSWAVVVYATHKAQWGKAEVILQTSKEEKARRLCEYATILYRNQPDWLRQRHPLKREPTALALEWEDGGRLFGIPGGDDQIRMFHPTLVIFDEIGFMADAGQCWNVAHPVSQQMIGVSSAGPGWMADQCQQ